MTEETNVRKGRCLCGGVRYTVHGRMRAVDFCHCSQCRRSSGHFVAASACRPGQLTLDTAESLRWFASSDTADRGFCDVCGSSLFWRPKHGRHLSVMAGTLDAPTGLIAVEHIFVDDKSDYYTIADGLPQHAGDPEHGS